MKAKFVLLVAAGLFLASASQAQFPGSYKDSRDRYEMNGHQKEILRDHRELRKDKRDIRYHRRQLKKDSRSARHRRHHHRSRHHHAHRSF